MEIIFITLLIAFIMALGSTGFWVLIHLQSRDRFGEQELGCKGPVPDKDGNAVCCKGDRLCDNPPENDPRFRKTSPGQS